MSFSVSQKIKEGFYPLPTVILRETLSNELLYKDYWHQLQGILIGNSVQKYIESRSSIKNPVVDYADKTTITPVLVTGEQLGLDFTKNITHNDILLRGYELGLGQFPEQFTVNYATNFFPWGEVGRNVKVVTNPIKRGKRDFIIFCISYNPRSIEEIVLTRHKFRPIDYFLFIKK